MAEISRARDGSWCIRGSVRRPIGHAAVGIASALMMNSATAQEALPTIEVEGSSGYQATSSGIGRLPTPLIDTPQTVNVVTQQVIQERNVTSLEEALRGVPGVTFSAGEGGQQGDNPIIRGFSARGDIYRDGIRDPGWYTRDTFAIDSVEVFKGPSSFAFGRGSTGAAINNNSKIATGASFAEITTTATTGPGYRVDADAGGRNGNVAGRIVLMGQNYDTPDRDGVFTKRFGFAPSMTVDVTDQTKVKLWYIYQDEHSVPDYGVPYLPQATVQTASTAVGGYTGLGLPVTPVPIARNIFLGTPQGLPFADIVDTTTQVATAKIEHEFSPDLKISNATRFMSNDRFSQPTPPRGLGNADNQVFQSGTTSGVASAGYPVALMTIGREHWNLETDNTMLLNQTDINAKFNTGGLQHTLVTGTEVSHETRYQLGRQYICYPTTVVPTAAPTGIPVCRQSLINPSNQGLGLYTPAGVYPNVANYTTFDNVAVYASDQIKINRYLELLAAGRFDGFTASYQDPFNVTLAPSARALKAGNAIWSYRVGAVVHPIENTSLYTAYGTSANPSAEFGTLTSGTAALDPEINTTLEIGGKIDLNGGQLSATAAYFRTEKENARVTGPDPTALPTILSGKQRVEGVELGLAGRLTSRWQAFGGFVIQDSEILSVGPFAAVTDQYTIGKHLPNAPPISFTSWTTYDLDEYWTIGGGAIYNAKDFVNTANLAYVPAYWRFDGMVSYKITKNATLQLNVYNIADAMYYAQYYSGQAVPASGRSASLSLRVRW